MYAKKSLGQHWLRSESARAKIVRAAQLTPGETVLEIGPGRGFLTYKLLVAGAEVVAVEKDDFLIEFLRSKFAVQIARGQFQLFHQDILDFNLDQLKTTDWKLVANIPYYLTGQIFRRFLGPENQPRSVTILVQKEVAERVVASEKESLLSLAVKAYGEPRYLGTVGRKAFAPPPNVDSAILRIDKISHERLAGLDEAGFFAFLKQGFGSKRKMLKNNLNLPDQNFLTCNLDIKVRPEELKLNDWVCLFKQKSSV
jgi:16S rRNA (adenine1518-N6/adenine1519-N6)-dimethyltransferase